MRMIQKDLKNGVEGRLMQKKSRICGILLIMSLAVSAELLGLTKHYAP